MKAIVVEQPGGPEVLQLKEIPTPVPRPGWVLIKIKAFGLNRSEMYTRQGQSGDQVPFPRVLGIECVGEVKDAGGSELQVGQKVAALMGDMGRKYHGGYAEYTLVPRNQVLPVETNLPWEQFAGIPETFMTAWGSLVESIGLKAGHILLVRGGTSSLGMAATSIAKNMGATVVATTRSEAKREALLANGVDHVIIDTGQIAGNVRALYPEGVDHVLELVGTVTLRDSFQTVRPKGVICVAGLLGNEWVLREFSPFELRQDPAEYYIPMECCVRRSFGGDPRFQPAVFCITKGRHLISRSSYSRENNFTDLRNSNRFNWQISTSA